MRGAGLSVIFKPSANYNSILIHKKVGTQLMLQGCRQGAGDEYVDIDFNVTVGSRIKTK